MIARNGVQQGSVRDHLCPIRPRAFSELLEDLEKVVHLILVDRRPLYVTLQLCSSGCDIENGPYQSRTPTQGERCCGPPGHPAALFLGRTVNLVPVPSSSRGSQQSSRCSSGGYGAADWSQSHPTSGIERPPYKVLVYRRQQRPLQASKARSHKAKTKQDLQRSGLGGTPGRGSVWLGVPLPGRSGLRCKASATGKAVQMSSDHQISCQVLQFDNEQYTVLNEASKAAFDVPAPEAELGKRLKEQYLKASSQTGGMFASVVYVTVVGFPEDPEIVSFQVANPFKSGDKGYNSSSVSSEVCLL